MNEYISDERKKYLYSKKKRKYLILLTQILSLIIFIVLWETLANIGIIDSFIMSKPSRIWQTLLNAPSNQIFMHLGVTCLETIARIFNWYYFRHNNCLHTMVV